ncbi:MAG: M48 family metalloprotease [Candidatus Omnitrophica bacterium]|nr:M48 family metalloprotease [Candidatus Omnitrophota bacterium]
MVKYKKGNSFLNAKKTLIFSLIILCASLSFAENITSLKPLPSNLVKLQNDLVIESNKAEDIIYKRGALYHDETVVTYINKIAQDLSAGANLPKENNINIKIIREPTVNAFALPNGSIYIHTGALARLHNEAQLAFLLSHEISHVVNKDSTYHTHDYHNKVASAKIFDVILTPTQVFFGILGDLAQIGSMLLHVSAITGYSREIEARADRDGIIWASEEGYDPRESASLINIFIAEKEKYQTGPEIFFLMNHPTNKWRVGQLSKIISERYNNKTEGNIHADEFLNNIASIKLYNADLNIKMDRLEHAKDNIQWVLDNFPDNPKAHYLAGEIYRLKAEDKNRLKYELNDKTWKELNKGAKPEEPEDAWRNEAIKEYTTCIECQPSYTTAYKGLGFLYYQKKDKETSLLNLNKYLELNPNPDDKRYVDNLIKKINCAEEKEAKK